MVDPAALLWFRRRRLASSPLLALDAGVFARSTEGSYLTAADAVAWAAVDALRVDLAQFGEQLYVIEGARTNYAISSETFSGWSAVLCVVANNAGTAPDGAGDASTVDYDPASNPRLALTITLPDGTVVSQSRWVKTSSGNGNSRLETVQRDGATTVSLNSTATGTWVREQQRGVSVGSGGSNPQFWHRASADATGPTVFHWGAQFEVGRYETSYIRTGGGSVTRQPDVWTWVAAEVPQALREAAATLRAAPWWSEADLAASDERWLLSIGGASDGIRVRNDAGTVKLEAVDGGSVVASKTLAGLTRRAAVDVAWDPVAGTVSWGGVAGAAGTPWAWPAGVSARLGGILGGVSEWDGGIGLPVAA